MIPTEKVFLTPEDVKKAELIVREAGKAESPLTEGWTEVLELRALKWRCWLFSSKC
jgi:hypothetical protein